jgi:AraC-like DNA-binding protein
MFAAPLCVGGHFGPFILRAAGNPRRHAPEAITTRQRDIYVLVAVETGGVDLAGPGAPRRHSGPCAYLLAPGEQLTVHCHPGTRWGQLVFTLTHAARRPGASPGSWVHRGPCQPDPGVVFGVHLPAMVPEALVARAVATVAAARTIYFKSPLHHAQANNLLGRWLLDYALTMAEPASGQDPVAVAERHARDHVDTGCTVAAMAVAAGLSAVRFGVVYREATGRTPRQYLDGLKLERACTELRAGTDIRHTAWRCGFRSPTSFTAFFQRQLGMTPRAWRQANR